MTMSSSEINRALFRAKMAKYVHGQGLTFGEWFVRSGFPQSRYQRLSAGYDVYLSTAKRFLEATDNHFSYSELADLVDK